MKKQAVKTTLFWVLLAEAVGGLAGWLTRDGMKYYNAQIVKPPLSPPPAVFPVVWTLLYACMGVGAARVVRSERSEARSDGIRLFLMQLAVNFAWTVVFFSLRTYGGALLVLALLLSLIVWMLLRFRSVDKTAGLLQIPYVLWTAFALYLNAGVWLLNR